jgi:hypothetical protein
LVAVAGLFEAEVDVVVARLGDAGAAALCCVPPFDAAVLQRRSEIGVVARMVDWYSSSGACDERDKKSSAICSPFFFDLEFFFS